MMKKVELLAPAGNYQAFLGAVCAGADAVYLGGEKFGARAYAENFTKEELCRALRYAHLCGRKIYLTLNTLIKENEFPSIYEYVAPFYEEGLDGIILQDLGVWQYIRETFPGLPLHASTQMTITGAFGAQFLKEIGASRIVPARELSLPELKQIKEQTGLELECFIHGAMCYCYSGQCLFSSILGGRSGNRGRCAQPCRLPYRITDKDSWPGTAREKQEIYPLSLKDMCTLEFLPKLMEAGIDSFKIEGRMKRPEYAAGVTAIYRKYIDKYYEGGADACRVEPEDMDMLRRLYIRSEIQTGYYERKNGREMITLKKPGYLAGDETLLSEIAGKYLKEEKKIPVRIEGVFRVGEPAALKLSGEGVEQVSYGAQVQKAENRPMDKASIAKQLCRMGNSHLTVISNEIETGESVFIPVGQLNELRRQAVEAFEDKLITGRGLVPYRELQKNPVPIQESPAAKKHIPMQIHVLISNLEQLEAVCDYPCGRIYLDSDFYVQEIHQICRIMQKAQKNEIFLALPYIIRKQDEMYLNKLVSTLEEGKQNGLEWSIKGFLVRNLESLFWARSLSGDYEVVTDAGVYCFHSQTARLLERYCGESYLPFELNGKECRKVIENSGRRSLSMVVYTTVPMMITANCVSKTSGKCRRGESARISYLTDRYRMDFPVLRNCRHCYNIIYNSVPYSLHGSCREWQNFGLSAARLDFILESGAQARDILDFYFGQKNAFPIEKYTAGHYRRGVE